MYLPTQIPAVYNILIKHYIKNGDSETAFSVLDEMRAHVCGDVGPNLVTYSTLFGGGICRVGKMKEAFELFEEITTGKTYDAEYQKY